MKSSIYLLSQLSLLFISCSIIRITPDRYSEVQKLSGYRCNFGSYVLENNLDMANEVDQEVFLGLSEALKKCNHPNSEKVYIKIYKVNAETNNKYLLHTLSLMIVPIKESYLYVLEAKKRETTWKVFIPVSTFSSLWYIFYLPKYIFKSSVKEISTTIIAKSMDQYSSDRSKE